jgi:predicted nucleic acid-binding protein
MIVVADTSPSTIWSCSDISKFWQKIYAEVVVPQSVLDELQDSDAPAEVRAWFSAPPTWLQVSTLLFRRDPLMERLDRGEQDAILLAESFKAERLIIDDLEGRREAVHRGLPVIGTLGLLAEAARRNLLDLSQVSVPGHALRCGPETSVTSPLRCLRSS